MLHFRASCIITNRSSRAYLIQDLLSPPLKTVIEDFVKQIAVEGPSRKRTRDQSSIDTFIARGVRV